MQIRIEGRADNYPCTLVSTESSVIKNKKEKKEDRPDGREGRIVKSRHNRVAGQKDGRTDE